MSGYRPPITDIRFTLEHVAGLDRLTSLPEFAHLDGDLLTGALEEAGRFFAEVIAPLARDADRTGSVHEPDGSVTTAPGYRQAYRSMVDAGWVGAAFPEEWGGGGLPRAVGVGLQEMVMSADMAFALCPMLIYSADALLMAHGTDEQKATWLPRLVPGDWTATMVLTEPQAGSDVGALRTRAVPADDGTWRITGSKIFITWGEHDMADNIVHVVLARTPGAPPGTRGISCFIVPKFLLGPDGKPDRRNDVTCVSLEEKVGIHGSPTCVLSFGDGGEGAVGYLVGEEHQGMRYMFTMMNHARLSTGLQGLALSERSYQQSAAYAQERRQGRPEGERSDDAAIIRHPDVRRMLMTMRSRIEAMRGVMYRNAVAVELAERHPEAEVREREAEIAAILTPISKAWGTDLGVEMTSLGIQIHGGMGYIEDTGIAQWWRDSRIAPIYEGTNGIQAIDLVARKLPLRGGDAFRELIEEARAEAKAAPERLSDVAAQLLYALDAVADTADRLQAMERIDSLAGATDFLDMVGDTFGGWMLLRGAIAAATGPDGYPEGFLEGRMATARFYAERILTGVPCRSAGVLAGGASVFAIPQEAFPGA